MNTLRRYRVLETGSVITARDNSPHFGRSGLRPIGRDDDFRMIVNSMILDGIRLSAVGTTGHRIEPVDSENVTVLSPLLGTLETNDGQRRLVVREGEVALPRPGRRRTTIPARYVGLVAQVPLARLQARAARNPLDWWQLDRDWAEVSGRSAALLRYLRYLVDEFDGGDTLLTSERASRSAAAMLTDLILDAVQPAAKVVSDTVLPADWQVRRAEDAILARLAEDISVASLAADLGVSTRALQLAFQRHRRMTPSQVVAAARLDAAHRRLSHAVQGDTVTAIALECGVTHFGRFAARYRARFGEHPSTALARRLRQV
ncbi:helix-turn-helix transcriptional regulator [Neoroseomonas lacus]|uniref:HTH araC/xylS-type domain-containing protein n=1 Tax=Neoroseomonas lacus TaxID=287609 RepID=A0A917K8G0_9PROT|nr:helix-turn-helix transcriptional regulator [Neoroseomonas lacus]GGJ03794.1 hypothetical protein GCM10011320_08500 [Neoroseomonas lacus]